MAVQPPIGDRAELHGEPEEGQHPRAGDFHIAMRPFDHRRPQLAVLALQPGNLAHLETDLFLLVQREHAVDAVGRGAEFGPAVDQGQPARQRLEVQRPVERGIAAANDQ